MYFKITVVDLLELDALAFDSLKHFEVFNLKI